MEIEIQIQLMYGPLFDKIQSHLEELTNQKLLELLAKFESELCAKFPSRQEVISNIIKEHSYVVRTPIRLDVEKKVRHRSDLVLSARCQSVTRLGSQCRRPRADGHAYCSSHLNKRSSMSGDSIKSSDSVKSSDKPGDSIKSGDKPGDSVKSSDSVRSGDSVKPSDSVKPRNKKKKAGICTSDLDTSLYIQAALTDIGGCPYLIDENLMIYKQGKNIIVGYVNKDSEVCWL